MEGVALVVAVEELLMGAVDVVIEVEILLLRLEKGEIDETEEELFAMLVVDSREIVLDTLDVVGGVELLVLWLGLALGL